MSAISTSDARWRSTGCPSRATLRMAMDSLLHKKRQTPHPERDDERAGGERRAEVERAACAGEIVEETGDDRAEKSRQRSDGGRQPEHAAVLARRRRLR